MKLVQKIKVLCWKNIFYLKDPQLLVCYVLGLVLYILALGWYLGMTKATDVSNDKTQMPRTAILNCSLSGNIAFTQNSIYYSPKTPQVDKLMEIVKRIHGNRTTVTDKEQQEEFNVQGFDDESAMMKNLSTMTKESFGENFIKPTYISVAFLNVENDSPLPSHITYQLVVPNPVTENSKSQLFLPNYVKDFNTENSTTMRKKLEDSKFCEIVQAELEVLTLQSSIDFAVIEYQTGREVEYNIFIKDIYNPPEKMPVVDHAVYITTYVHMHCYLLMFTFATIVLIEKNSGMKEVLKQADMSPELSICMWYLLFLVMQLIMSFIFSCAGYFRDFSVSIDFVSHFILTFVYCASSISTALLFSSVVRKGGLLFVFSFLYEVPLLLFTQLDMPTFLHPTKLTIVHMVLMMFFPNLSYAVAVEILCYAALYGKTVNLGWEKTSLLFCYPSFGCCVLLIVVGGLIHFLLALYLDYCNPGKYGVAFPFWYPLTKKFWLFKFGKSKYCFGSIDPNNKLPDNPAFQRAYDNDQIAVQIRNLRKTYSKKVAVDNVNANIYKNKITVLLGHNGAGKTTTLHMIIGLISPSNGIINIDGDQKSVGFCPQENVFFKYLNSKQHLKLFSLLRGQSFKESKPLVEAAIQRLALGPVASLNPKKLSGGQKRKLCIAISLVSASDLVVLDEPSAGLDPAAKKDIWNSLLALRKSHTILLTTHNMEEAEILADRILIMHGGSILCDGYADFLKNYYETGYSLMLLGRVGWNPLNVFAAIKEIIPGTKIKHYFAQSASFNLTNVPNRTLVTLFDELENRKAELNIQSFSVTVMNLEEVFIKAGDWANKQEGLSVIESETINIDDVVTKSGAGLFFMQLLSILLKRFFLIGSSLWNIVECILILLAPLIIMGLRYGLSGEVNPESFYNISLYKDMIIFSNMSNGEVAGVFANIVEKAGHEYREAKNALDDIRLMSNISEDYAITKVLFSVEFANDSITAYCGTQAKYSRLVALNVLTNSILQSFANSSDYSINMKSRMAGENMGDALLKNEFIIPPSYVLGIVLIIQYFVAFTHYEYASQIKQVQLLSGVPRVVYWMGTYMIDMALLTIGILLGCIGYLFLPEYKIGTVLHLCFSFGFAQYVWFYNMHYFGKNSLRCILSIDLMLAIMVQTVLGLANSLGELCPPGNTSTLCYVMYMLCGFTVILLFTWPTFAFIFLYKKYCIEFMGIGQIVTLLMGDQNPSKIARMWRGLSGTGWIIVTYLIECIIYWSYFMVADSGYIRIVFEKCRAGYLKQFKELEEDVIFEKQDVLEQIRKPEKERDPVLANSLQKMYIPSICSTCCGKIIAVKSVSFRVPESTCFGLLGTNGAGKSTTFKMLSGQVGPTYGSSYICGRKRTLFNQIYCQKRVGYCPQENLLFDSLTGNQTLIIFAFIRGVPIRDVKETVKKWIVLSGLQGHEKKHCGNYSGGLKRKLSVTLALLGSPPVLMMDEPTEGIDPVARRRIWSFLELARAMKKTIILTSHNMEECEALCDRVGIMVSGQFRCIGDVQYLKRKYTKGFSILIRLYPENHDEYQNTLLEAAMIQKIQCIQIERQMFMLTFKTTKDYKMSELFNLMDELKSNFSRIFKEYNITDVSFRQVFLSFAEL